MRCIVCFLCMMLTVYADNKKPAKPRQAPAHYVGVGRPKKQIRKKSDLDAKKWFSSTTLLKKRKQKHIAEKKGDREKRPFYQKTQR